MKIYFLIPVFNESPNIAVLANDLLKVLPNFQKYFIFIDDCSNDNTIELIKNYFIDSDFSVITKKCNMGPGDSFNKGFELILSISNNENDLISIGVNSPPLCGAKILPLYE